MTRNLVQTRGNSLLRVGDSVMVIAGGNKTTNVLKRQVGRILVFAGDRVIVEGLNFGIKYKRPTRVGERGTAVRSERSIHVSNVMYYVDALKRPVRLSSKVRSDGKKERGYRDPVSKEFIYLG
jgi:ribosomal protein L24